MRNSLFTRTVILLAVASLAASVSVQAGLTHFEDRAAFEVMGCIFENWDFSDWPSDSWNYPPEPYYTHGVTYSTDGGELMIAGADMIGMADNHVVNNFWTPIDGVIDPGYDMFGADMTGIFSGGTITVTIYTNANAYVYSMACPGPPESIFMGFVADSSEEITGFHLTGEAGVLGPALTHVTLGIVDVSPTEATNWSSLKALY